MKSFPKVRSLAWKQFQRSPAHRRIAMLVVFSAALFVLTGEANCLLAQTHSSKSNHDLEGDWVRTDLSGSGSFGGLSDRFEKAVLTAAGMAMVASSRQGPTGPAYSENRPHGAGDPYIVVDRPCGGGFFGGGALGINPDSGAIHIIVQKEEVIIAPERGGVRRIYMDGRTHPNLSRWTPIGSGHGIGHFEGQVLVVDTLGLTPGPVPAGGWRTPETHLSERFEVSPDGNHLTIKYTWSDPKIYVKPHSYQYTFDRLPAGSYAFEAWCDASDPVERQSIVPPPQE